MALAGDCFDEFLVRLRNLQIPRIAGIPDMNRQHCFFRPAKEERCALNGGPVLGRECDAGPKHCALRGG